MTMGHLVKSLGRGEDLKYAVWGTGGPGAWLSQKPKNRLKGVSARKQDAKIADWI